MINVPGDERHCDTEPEIAEAGATGARRCTDRDINTLHHIGECANALFLCRTDVTGVAGIGAGIVVILIAIITVLSLILNIVTT